MPSQQDCRGYNALHYAAAAGNYNATQHLLDFGGSELFFSRPDDNSAAEVTTPLHLAAFYGHRDALLILIAKFRNVEVLDGQGRSPLYLASYAGKLRNVEVLDGQGRSPLYLASYAGKFRNVEVLDGQGRSPLYLASHAGKLRNVEVLDGQGRSPLYLASCTTFVWRAVILICMCYNSYPGSAMGPIRIWQSFGSGYAWIRINLPSWIQIRIQE